QNADAERSFVRALELQPESLEILRDLTLFYLRENQTDKAFQRLNTVADNKKQAIHFELLGLAYSQAGKQTEAEAAYRKGLEKDPSRIAGDVYLFSSYMQNGRVEDGLKKLDEIIKKTPSNTIAYGAKAQIYQGQGKVQEAKEIYVQALKADPNS